jgi:hypothetical protein
MYATDTAARARIFAIARRLEGTNIYLLRWNLTSVIRAQRPR